MIATASRRALVTTLRLDKALGSDSWIRVALRPLFPRSTPVTLVTREAIDNPSVRLVRHDLAGPVPSDLRGAFDVARAANILNAAHFTRAQQSTCWEISSRWYGYRGFWSYAVRATWRILPRYSAAKKEASLWLTVSVPARRLRHWLPKCRRLEDDAVRCGATVRTGRDYPALTFGVTPCVTAVGVSADIAHDCSIRMGQSKVAKSPSARL